MLISGRRVRVGGTLNREDSPGLTRLFNDNKFTHLQREVFKLVAMGMSNSEIAKEMLVKNPAVLWHITNIFKKLGLKRRTQLIVLSHEVSSTLAQSK